jgi:hypothetical protein
MMHSLAHHRFEPTLAEPLSRLSKLLTILVSYHRAMSTLANVLRVASVPVGALIGLWTAHLTSLPSSYRCPTNAFCLPLNFYFKPTFAIWQCALFGAGAAVVLLLMSFAMRRLPRARPLKAA